jgi:hypothetical protein
MRMKTYLGVPSKTALRILSPDVMTLVPPCIVNAIAVGEEKLDLFSISSSEMGVLDPPTLAPGVPIQRPKRQTDLASGRCPQETLGVGEADHALGYPVRGIKRPGDVRKAEETYHFKV